MDIAEFLLARIGEDEAVALEATSGPWRWDEDPENGMESATALTYWDDDDTESKSWPKSVIDATGLHTEGFVLVEPGDRAHIARHDPARVLADCDVKRRIVEGIRDATDIGRTPAYIGPVLTSDDVLELLAVPYADHPDYDPEWKP